MLGIIFDIQNYAIYDGPGIRTCVYFKGCPLSCYWCHNPESQKPKPEMAYWEERCARCGACVEACSREALRLDGEKIIRDTEVCTACGDCAEACPNEAMERIGFEIAAGQVVERVMRDKAFYENSGGGVTVSGGEPTFQKDFLFDLLGSLKSSGIHTAVETCGYFSENLLEPLTERTDLFLYDLKHIDTEPHRETTGVTNDRILANFSGILAKAGVDRIVPRIPLIPGFNTGAESIEKFISFLRNAGYTGSVHLMPYHGWARGKYKRTGRDGSFRDPGKITGPELESIGGIFERAGFAPLCYG